MDNFIGSFKSHEVKFISDTHFGHANIMKYCNRPFQTVDQMDRYMLANMKDIAYAGKTIIHLGDAIWYRSGVDYNSYKLHNAKKHIFVRGNHDNSSAIEMVYPQMFGNIYGKGKNWKTFSVRILVDDIPILLSHEPQPKSQFKGCKYNFYGHHHNNIFKNPDYFIKDYAWLFDNESYVNVSVELTEYRPISFQEALSIPRPTKGILNATISNFNADNGDAIAVQGTNCDTQAAPAEGN